MARRARWVTEGNNSKTQLDKAAWDAAKLKPSLHLTPNKLGAFDVRIEGTRHTAYAG